MNVSNNNQIKLSSHFTLGEMTKTSYHPIDGNIPSRVHVENLINLCENWLEELRARYNLMYVASPQPVSPPESGASLQPISPPESGGVRGGLNTSIIPRVQTTPPAGTPPDSGGEEETEAPIIINSGFRSEEVNRLCGGASHSNHLTGCAVDIRCMGKDQAIRYACILLDIADEKKQDLTSSRVCSRSATSMQASRCARSNADFDELILEKRGTTIWVHFAVRPRGNRRYVHF
jgi:hypothetical protein